MGAVEVFVNQRQPEGKIILKLDSKLNVSFRDGSGKQIDELIIECQEAIPDNIIKKKEPIRDRKTFLKLKTKEHQKYKPSPITTSV